MDFSVYGFQKAYELGTFEERIQCYLDSQELHNPNLATAIRRDKAHWSPPVRMKVDYLSADPERTTLFKTSEWRVSEIIAELGRVSEIIAEMECDDQDICRLRPLIVRWHNEQFHLADGNHRYEAFRRLGLPYCWVLMTTHQEWKSFSV